MLKGAEHDRMESVMATLFAAKGADYAHLHSLRIAIEFMDVQRGFQSPLQTIAITPLLSLPSLHTLTLTSNPRQGFHWTAFRFLLSLSLTHIDLHSLWVDLPVKH